MTQTTEPPLADVALDRRSFFIAGEWCEPADAAASHVIVEPATEEPLGRATLASPADVDRAVAAARRAQDTGPWARADGAERAAVLRAFAAALTARADETSTLVTRENGMPIGLSRAVNGFVPAFLLGMYADLVDGRDFEERRPTGDRSATIVRREPVGVVAAVAPWNFPQALAMLKVAPALAAGCSVVLKPSPETALDGYVLAEAACDAGLPEGVLNVVPADRDAGAHLVGHPGVDKVAFTGSTSAGEQIGATCGRLIRRMTLELGGKSASIVLPDVDLDVFYQGLGNSSFQNSGQACISQTRILAPRSRYDEVVDAVVRYAREQVVGNPLDESVTCGPMATREHLERVLGHVERARASGARLVTGGGRSTAVARGWFVEPTVFADVDNASPLAQEEVFGPVLAVIPYGDEDEAVALANDSRYGLAGSVWTSDIDRGLDIARRVRTGTIGVNTYNLDLGAPFGGMKASGIGREAGPEGLEAYFEIKSIYTVS
jgi:aldehyde dehydrogenase (NAD+)